MLSEVGKLLYVCDFLPVHPTVLFSVLPSSLFSFNLIILSIFHQGHLKLKFYPQKYCQLY